MRLIEEDNRLECEKDFNAWCDFLTSLPEDFEPKVKDGLKADLELQPARWLGLGLDLIQSSKIIAHVQLSNALHGRPHASLLCYPVFQMGTEIFLKGMWLCHFDDFRLLTAHSYTDEVTRENFTGRLGRRLPGHAFLGHDLLEIVNVLREIPEYRSDPPTMRFLKLVDSVTRYYYFPFHKADKGPSRWANARYPKRFYDDKRGVGSADAFHSYPPQDYIAELFEEMKRYLHRFWNLPSG